MKAPILFTALLFTACYAFAQNTDRNTVATPGVAQKIMYPKSYRVRFLLMEENMGENSKGIIKIPLDTLKLTFFKNLKAYGVKEGDLTVLHKSSTQYNNGRANPTLYNIVYELKAQKLALAQRLVDDLRFEGLKGVVAKPQYPMLSTTVQDSLFKAAMEDAHRNAETLAKQAGKIIGEVYNISTYNSAARDFTETYDPTDIYNVSKFDIGAAEYRPLSFSITVTYELKKM